MRDTITRVRGTQLAIAAAAGVVVISSWLSIPYVRHHLKPAIPQFDLPTSERTAERELGKMLGRIFSSPEPVEVDPRAAALKQLEAAGLPPTGDSLVRTVATGHQPLVELLLTAGVNVNAPGAGGRTALLAALASKEWNMATYLLERGADVSLADLSGLTPLMAASSGVRTDLLQKLIAGGAALDSRDANGRTALHFAVAARNTEGLLELIKAGANPAVDSDADVSLVRQAFTTRDWKIVEPVLERQPAELKWNPDSRSLLMQAMTNQDKKRAGLLLAKHPAAPTAEGFQQPLLAYAVVSGNFEQFKFLLDCGASPDTSLGTPAEKSFIEKVQGGYLRHYLGSEPGMTVLMLAAGMGEKRYVEELLNRGAKRGQGTLTHKMPASVFAARSGEHTDTLQLLLGKGSPAPEELRVEISLGAQRASLIKNGVMVMSTRVSTGRSGFSTPTGKYVVTDKHRSHVSTIYKVKMPFFMRLSYRDFGMHQGVVPNQPASHGCIRVPSGTIEKLFSEVPVGTLVTIF